MVPNDPDDSFAHSPEVVAAEGRAPLAALREGQEVTATVTALLLYHGAQVLPGGVGGGGCVTARSLGEAAAREHAVPRTAYNSPKGVPAWWHY